MQQEGVHFSHQFSLCSLQLLLAIRILFIQLLFFGHSILVYGGPAGTMGLGSHTLEHYRRHVAPHKLLLLWSEFDFIDIHNLVTKYGSTGIHTWLGRV